MSEPKLDPVNTRDHLSEPVREKLQETTISPLRANGEEQEDESLDSSDMAVETRAQARQRARKEAEENEAEKSTDLKHKPSVKKSTKPEQQDQSEPAIATAAQPEPSAAATGNANGTSGRTTPPVLATDAPMKGMSSPTTGKRGRDDFEDDTQIQPEETEAIPAVVAPEVAAKPEDAQESTSTERAPKRQRSESPKMTVNSTPDAPAATAASQPSQPPHPTTKIPPRSGFANTSSASPFGSLAKPSAGGFGNTSSASPFGTLAGSKSPLSGATSPQPQTSSSAFAASGFGSMANQSASGFGSLAKPNGGASPFAAAAPAVKPSGFGSNTPGSGFGALGSSKLGFGNSTPGGGFGALAGGPKLSGFGGGSASLPPITGLSSTPAVPFGTPATGKDNDDDDDGSTTEADDAAEEGDESSQKEKSATAPAKSKAEPVHISNGEENEETMFSTRAKIYAFVTDTDDTKPAWKERGVGVLKVNIDKTSWDEAAGIKSPEDKQESEDVEAQAAPTKPKARLVMRADATNRLILNSPIQKGTLFGEKPAASKTTVMLLGLLQGQDGLQKLQVKMKADQLQEFWDFVQDIQVGAS